MPPLVLIRQPYPSPKAIIELSLRALLPASMKWGMQVLSESSVTVISAAVPLQSPDQPMKRYVGRAVARKETVVLEVYVARHTVFSVPLLSIPQSASLLMDTMPALGVEAMRMEFPPDTLSTLKEKSPLTAVLGRFGWRLRDRFGAIKVALTVTLVVA